MFLPNAEFLGGSSVKSWKELATLSRSGSLGHLFPAMADFSPYLLPPSPSSTEQRLYKMDEEKSFCPHCLNTEDTRTPGMKNIIHLIKTT